MPLGSATMPVGAEKRAEVPLPSVLPAAPSGEPAKSETVIPAGADSGSKRQTEERSKSRDISSGEREISLGET